MLKNKNILNLLLILVFVSSFVFLPECKKKVETEDFKIGAILPLTGKAGRYGQYIRQGLELAREEINQGGGINGKNLEIIYEDDQADPKLAASAISKLAEMDKVPVVFGSWASSCVLALAPIAERTRTVVMAEAISPKIRDAGDFIFRIQPDARYYIKQFVPFLYNELSIEKVAILYINNDFGVDQARIFEEGLEKLGGEVIYKSGFPQGATDFRAEISKIKNISPKAVFVPAYTEIGVFLKQAKESTLEAQFLASVPFENPEILAISGEAAEMVLYPYHYGSVPENELDVNFRRDFESKYGYQPDGFAALAYDGLKIIAHVLKRTVKDAKSIKAELYSIKDLIGVTGPSSFDDHGDVIKPIIIKTVYDGKYVSFESVREKFLK